MMIFTFIPWLLFWTILLVLHHSEAAAVAGVITSLILPLISLLRGKSIKLLQIATLFFFTALCIIALITDLEKYWILVRISCNIFIALTILFSIIFKRPFTLQYAQEKFSKQIIMNAQFLHINYVISWVWFGFFVVGLIIPASRLFGYLPPKWLGPSFSILTVFLAFKFTLWYSRRKSPIS